MRARWLAAAFVSLSSMTATVVAAQDTGPTVEATVGTAVADRQLQGAAESFPTTVGRVFCYTKIAKTQAGANMEHVWYHDSTEVGRVKLTIGGSPWRSWSSKNVPPEATGDWHVDVVADGKVVKSVAFKVQ